MLNLRERAEAHVKEMEEKYAKQIAETETTVYGPYFHPEHSSLSSEPIHEVKLVVEQADSVSAVFSHANEKTTGRVAVANFASYLNPGGHFILGAKAQEEYLCYESTLYNVLSRQQDYYEWNNLAQNSHLYRDRALYSKDILFERNGNTVTFDVLSCAAPNFREAKRTFVTRDENELALLYRIRFIKDVLEAQNVETFIFGAFGCGVFGQDPYEVASICRSVFAESRCIRTVYFSIIDEPTTNAFRSVIMDESGVRTLIDSRLACSSYNEGTPEQLDYYMNEGKCDVHDVAFLFSHEERTLTKMEIAHIICWSDDPSEYDRLLENEDILLDGEELYDADTSAEFITDNDSYLVWFAYVEEKED